ncbi:putative lipase atg15 [Coniosporium tulheliwenetii]|uniref:Lipase atg15 n=1 Tax=Coniosporium tulheliwenetii TaxID=3383036 RepID=A0ACC2ZPE4_9PEZI|nr:putative lipase atg15 [Cladosporium sp. JES 115]
MLPTRYHHTASGLTATLLFTFLALSSWTIRSVAASGQAVAEAAVLPEVPVLLPPGAPSEEQTGRAPGADGQLLEFKLQHIFHHGTHKYPRLHRRLDVPADARLLVTSDEAMDPEPAPRLRARSQRTTIQRLADRSASHINDILEYGRMNGHPMPLPASAWTEDELSGPNATDKETVLSFARMASNAYILEPHTGEWQDVGGGFNYTEDFGWQADGLRGHIFADTENKTVIIGLKGTCMPASPYELAVAVFDGADTTTNDKVNDNLFFSCCCGQGGSFLWLQVCDCQTSTYTCNSTCLVQALKAKNHYYYAVQDLYHNVTAIYPEADIWVTGHSLGGSVVSLLGLTFGLPTVTFEAPGEALPAMRLGLPTPPGYRAGSHQQRANTGGYHFGHTADPIFMGTCGMCTLAGYAMQSVCHSGLTCEYDTVKDFGWRQGLGYHRIVNVIHNVIEKYDQPAKCEPYEDCVDCFNWKFFESNSSTTTTSSRSDHHYKHDIIVLTNRRTRSYYYHNFQHSDSKFAEHVMRGPGVVWLQRPDVDRQTDIAQTQAYRVTNRQVHV